MKHMLNVVAKNEAGNWFLAFDPATATLTHWQPLALEALEAFIQDDVDALLASLPPLTPGRPGPYSRSDMTLMGQDDQGRILFACVALAKSWDGTEGTDGYGYFELIQYRFRIVEVTSTSVIPVAEVSRSSLRKQISNLNGRIIGTYNGLAYFTCSAPVAENHTKPLVITLAADGPRADAIGDDSYFPVHAFFNSGPDVRLISIDNRQPE